MLDLGWVDRAGGQSKVEDQEDAMRVDDTAAAGKMQQG